MPLASTSRTQKSAKATRSQPRRVQGRIDPDESDDVEQAENDDMEPEPTQGKNESDLSRKVNDLVRLALFSEHKRTPLRREEISKKVLGSHARSFNIVFENAQRTLRSTFGMELVELQSRAELEKTSNAPNDELDEARKATGVKRKVTAAGSKTYILRSVLDPAIIEYAALTDEAIFEDEAADAPDDEDSDPFGFRTYGSIISWSQADQLGAIGLLYVILTLILVSGRVMSDVDLRSNLRRLRLPPVATIALNDQVTHKPPSVDAYLTQLIRQGYIDRQRIGENKGAGTKRGRPQVGTQRGNGEDVGTWEWRWGNRAASEVGEMNIAKFAAEFMVERAGDDAMDDDDEEDTSAKAKGKSKGKGKAKAKQKAGNTERRMGAMMKAIERAAGGNLTELL